MCAQKWEIVGVDEMLLIEMFLQAIKSGVLLLSLEGMRAARVGAKIHVEMVRWYVRENGRDGVGTLRNLSGICLDSIS